MPITLPVASFLLLFAALAVTLCRPASRYGAGLALASASLAAAAGLIAPEGMAVLALAAGLLVLHRRAGSPHWRRVALALLGIWALANGLHALPGFTALEWNTTFGRDGTRVLRWHFDKGMGGWVLLYALARQGWPDWRRRLACLPAGIAVVVAAACALGIATFEPAWPTGALTWLAGNLFLTVIAEEAFFRGLLQSGLERVRGLPFPVALMLPSLLFACAHAGWGLSFAALALLAGCFYGLMFGRAHALGWAILAHWLLNAATLLLTRSPLG